jgi:hypothetical protein
MLFLVGVVATVLLNGVARSADQSEPVQWVAQSLNTLNQLVFMLASWRLWRVQHAAVDDTSAGIRQETAGGDSRGRNNR